MKEHKLLRVFWEILLGAFLLMPLIVTLIYSFVKRWTGVLPEGLTLQYYLAAVTNQSFLLGIFSPPSPRRKGRHSAPSCPFYG